MNHINHATERALAKELRTYTRYPICTQGADVIVRLADQLEAQDRHREQVAEMGRKVVEKAEAEITALRAKLATAREAMDKAAIQCAVVRDDLRAALEAIKEPTNAKS